MEINQILETRGAIIKEERVKSLESNILENSLVLENTDAFPGYFGENLPDNTKPRSLFIILDKKYDGLFLARTLKNISAKMDHKCYGSFGDITIKSKVFNCIRIKNLECFPTVKRLQQAIIDAKVGIMKYQNIDENALIRIHKSFLMQPISEGIYRDLYEQDRFCFTIPLLLKWDEFKKITSLVKSNMENSMFDAALGFIWRVEGLMDIVRIYDKNLDLNRIKIIRDKYLIEIVRFLQ
jgi:hypothetical protein